MNKKILYLDNAATTSLHPEVIQTITNTMSNVYGNPSSLHSIGHQAKAVFEQARSSIANHIHCQPDEILFTSGACEGNSLAIQGYLNRHPNSLFITTPLEHKSILALCKDLPSDCAYVNATSAGFIDLDHLEALCSNASLQGYSHLLVSIQSANSEIGTIQDMEKISEIVHKYHGVLHTDATQLFPYKRIAVEKLPIDMLSMSGQKIHGPKGIGVLYVKNNIELKPLIYGSQMESRRGGTENVPYIAGLAKAVELLDYNHTHMKAVRDDMINQLLYSNLDCRINGDLEKRLPNNINVSFKDVDAESILLMLDHYGICVSSGSACNSKSMTASETLTAIGVPKDYIHGTIRITLPKDITYEDGNDTIQKLHHVVNSLREFHLFDMT